MSRSLPTSSTGHRFQCSRPGPPGAPLRGDVHQTLPWSPTFEANTLRPGNPKGQGGGAIMCHPRNKGLLQEMIRNVEVWPGFPNMMSFGHDRPHPKTNSSIYSFSAGWAAGSRGFLDKTTYTACNRPPNRAPPEPN